MKILTVIPAYNEEACLADTVCSLVKACPDVDYVVVNDGSKDATQQIADKNQLNCISLPVNTGLTSAFCTGMKYALKYDYDAVVQFDADGQHIASYIPHMAKLLEEQNADIVIASRYLDKTEKPKGMRGLGSRLISFLIRILTGAVITDPTSGMRMYNKKMILRFCKNTNAAPEPDFLAMVAKDSGKIVELQAKILERQGGQSYLKPWNAVKYMARTCSAILLTNFLR